MSRLRNLKESNKKIIMKATSYGLALALFLGSSQGLGTYALFTDSETIPSEISLSTGDVDVEVNKGKELTDLKPGAEEELGVVITNKGTLNQNVRLTLDISDSIKKYIDYEFNFKEYNISVDNDGVMKKGEDLFILAPGERIIGNINVTVKDMDIDKQNELAADKNEKKIDLTVKSTQINKDKVLSENGFYDEATQENTITIAEGNIITVDTSKNVHYINIQGSFYKSAYIPVNINGVNEVDKDSVKVKVTAQGLGDIYNAEYVEIGEFKYIKITPSQGTSLEFKDNINLTINIKIGDREQDPQYYWIEQPNAGNSCKKEPFGHPINEDQFRCSIGSVHPGNRQSSTLEEKPIQDIVEVPNNPEVVEPPKEEEIEVPSKPEVVEPPKENEELL